MLDSLLYLIIISIAAFPLGRLIPKKYLHYDRYPFLAFEWEDSGKIYNRLGIRKWQNKVPDMSKIASSVMKPKMIKEHSTEQDIRYLLDETCVAELVHALQCVFGMYCMLLWRGAGGIIFSILYVVLCNMPFIMIQRYNRPRLARLYEKMKNERSQLYEGTDTELQYGRRS